MMMLCRYTFGAKSGSFQKIKFTSAPSSWNDASLIFAVSVVMKPQKKEEVFHPQQSSLGCTDFRIHNLEIIDR